MWCPMDLLKETQRNFMWEDGTRVGQNEEGDKKVSRCHFWIIGIQRKFEIRKSVKIIGVGRVMRSEQGSKCLTQRNDMWQWESKRKTHVKGTNRKLSLRDEALREKSAQKEIVRGSTQEERHDIDHPMPVSTDRKVHTPGTDYNTFQPSHYILH